MELQLSKFSMEIGDIRGPELSWVASPSLVVSSLICGLASITSYNSCFSCIAVAHVTYLKLSDKICEIIFELFSGLSPPSGAVSWHNTILAKT